MCVHEPSEPFALSTFCAVQNRANLRPEPRCRKSAGHPTVGNYDERYQKRYGFWRPVIAATVEKFIACGDLREGYGGRIPDAARSAWGSLVARAGLAPAPTLRRRPARPQPRSHPLGHPSRRHRRRQNAHRAPPEPRVPLSDWTGFWGAGHRSRAPETGSGGIDVDGVIGWSCVRSHGLRNSVPEPLQGDDRLCVGDSTAIEQL